MPQEYEPDWSSAEARYQLIVALEYELQRLRFIASTHSVEQYVIVLRDLKSLVTTLGYSACPTTITEDREGLAELINNAFDFEEYPIASEFHNYLSGVAPFQNVLDECDSSVARSTPSPVVPEDWHSKLTYKKRSK